MVGSSPTVRVCGQICHIWNNLNLVRHQKQMKRRDAPQALFRQNLASYWTAATNIWTIRMLLGCAPGHPGSGPLCMLPLNGFHSQMVKFPEIKWPGITSGLVCLGPRFRGWSGTGFRADLLPWPDPRQMLDDAMTTKCDEFVFMWAATCNVYGVQGGSTRQQTSPKRQPKNWAMVTVDQCLSIINCH